MINAEKYPTILKLQKLVKMGYCPARLNQDYRECFQFKIPNCFAHACFNLTNEQIATLSPADYKAFRGFIQSIFHANKYIAKDLIEFVKQCGLKVKKSNTSLPKHDNEWKVALYFGSERFKKDFHFLLLEKDGRWSGKHGESYKVSYYDEAPKFLEYNYEYPLELYGIYKITNPYAPKKIDKHEIEEEIDI